MTTDFFCGGVLLKEKGRIYFPQPFPHLFWLLEFETLSFSVKVIKNAVDVLFSSYVSLCPLGGRVSPHLSFDLRRWGVRKSFT